MPTAKELTNTLLDDLASDLKPIVNAIEQQVATTRNHYGDYLTIITGGPEPKRGLMALALLRAGANRQGMVDALRIAGMI